MFSLRVLISHYIRRVFLLPRVRFQVGHMKTALTDCRVQDNKVIYNKIAKQST